MFIRDQFHPKVIVSDEFGRFIMLEICYEGQVLWLVGVYASNVSQERKLLWRSLNSLLDNGRPGFLMGYFNVCFVINKSTFIHSIMDGPEAQEWGYFETKVMLRDVWKWIKGDELGYTFQSTQYKDTWSRLDRIYVMHTEGFLPYISGSYRSTKSDHFPLIF